MIASGEPTAVLVHGLWHGSWAWDAVRAALAARGVESVAPDLPLTTLADDAAVLRGVLEDLPGPVVLVGHSYGGAVVTAAGDHPAVRNIVFLAAFALTEAESISRVAPDAAVPPTRLGEALRFSADGNQVLLDPAAGRQIIYGGTPEPVATAALARLRPVGRALFSARPKGVAWRTRRAVYAICTADECVAPELQRIMAARCEDQVEWDSDHSPAAGHPELVADLVTAEVASAR